MIYLSIKQIKTIIVVLSALILLMGYYNMGVSLEVILYSTTHVSPRHVLAHTCQ